MDGLSLSQSLLELVFENKPAPKESTNLTPLQRTALETIRDNGAFKIGDGSFGNYSLMLRNWGVPDTPRAIDEWLRST